MKELLNIPGAIAETIGDDVVISFTPDGNGSDDELTEVKEKLLNSHLRIVHAEGQDPGLAAYQAWDRNLARAKSYLYQHYPTLVAHEHLLSCGVFIMSSDYRKKAHKRLNGGYEVDGVYFDTAKEAIKALQS